MTTMSDPFSDDGDGDGDDRPKFGKVKFGQPDTETETDDALEKRTKKKTKGRKRYTIIFPFLLMYKVQTLNYLCKQHRLE